MRWNDVKNETSTFLLENPENYVSADVALDAAMAGIQIFDRPIFAVADAQDAMFAQFQSPGVVHPDYALPDFWVPGARRVVSFFVPFTQAIRESNREGKIPSHGWLHGRWEGEKLLVQVRCFLRDAIRKLGYQACAPMHDERFHMLAAYAPIWSERHTAYACGLGTFGMSRGIITQKGMAGRLGSVVTDWEDIPITQRTYEDRYAHCIRCGQCAARCPVRCIDPEKPLDDAKNSVPCDAFLKHVKGLQPQGEVSSKRYGCGKCQVGVPCEAQIPT